MPDYDKYTVKYAAEAEELKILVKKFFEEYLDATEFSDSGREFHPVQISCCRSMKIDPLNKLMKRMRKLSGIENERN